MPIRNTFRGADPIRVALRHRLVRAHGQDWLAVGIEDDVLAVADECSEMPWGIAQRVVSNKWLGRSIAAPKPESQAPLEHSDETSIFSRWVADTRQQH